MIIVDGDYVDKVAFNLTVNFERMLERRVARADLAHWLDCVALDGGLREGENEVQVVFIHRNERLANFNPSDYADLNGKAFKDGLGEFAMSAYKVEDIVAPDEFFVQVLDLLKAEKEIRRLIVVPNAEAYIDKVKHALRDCDKLTTVLAMQPITGGSFRQEILGYSLMSALGIRAEEINEELRS